MLLLLVHRGQMTSRPTGAAGSSALLASVVAAGCRAEAGAGAGAGAGAQALPLSTHIHSTNYCSNSSSSKFQAFWRSRTCKLSSEGMAGPSD